MDQDNFGGTGCRKAHRSHDVFHGHTGWLAIAPLDDRS